MTRHERFWGAVDRIGVAGLSLAAVAALALPWVPAPPDRHERLILTAFGVGVYLCTFLLASLLFGRGLQTLHRISFRAGWARACRWVWRWHGLVLSAVAAGGFAGALLFAAGGTVLGMDGTVSEFARHGFLDGAFYLLIWAPGGALVVCFMLAFGKKNAGA